MESIGANLQRRHRAASTNLQLRAQKKQNRLFVDHEFIEWGYLAYFKFSTTAVYFTLAKYANFQKQNCYPSQSRIMKDTGIGSKNTLLKALKELERFNLIKINHSKGYASNDYYMLSPAVWKRVGSDFDEIHGQKMNEDSVKKDTLNIISESNKEIDKDVPVKGLELIREKRKLLGI